MEPADIDWKRVVSRFVRDEAFENINAPKWVDLTDPDASFPVDDDAWFCRPDCNHPKTLEDFQRLASPSPKGKGKIMRSSSEKSPFGERNCNNLRENNNLKRRGGIGTLIPPSSPFRSPIKSKKQREDTENQDPNLPKPTGALNGGKNWKDPVKCSAKKNNNLEEEKEELLCQQEEIRQPRLKSTLSARNLFSGRDILGQITEFCNEIKRMAVGAREVSQVVEENQKENCHEERPVDESPSKFPSDRLEKKTINMKMDLRVETAKGRGDKGILREKTGGVLRELRASPPTPQRFPSPSAQRLMHTKLTSAMSSNGIRSPLRNMPKSTPERKRLRDIMKESTEDQKLLISKDENCTEPSIASHTGGNPTGMFWFLKPCTYLVE
ncbi:interferon-activable protein [Rhynchospora pubera]|uniref:Interferon-activable protein n=1 Tax=Rhynchospora pubera TaxID=906938 RepID=A0AAV8FZP7_9POAL|nr:interferon-activable protein [Rhynchospora pubera]